MDPQTRRIVVRSAIVGLVISGVVIGLTFLLASAFVTALTHSA